MDDVQFLLFTESKDSHEEKLILWTAYCQSFGGKKFRIFGAVWNS